MENKSSFLKDAIESITTLANKAKEPKTLEYNSHLYLIDEGGNANRIWEPKDTPQRKRVCSLDAWLPLSSMRPLTVTPPTRTPSL